MSTAAETLAASQLFSDMSETLLADVGRLMSPVSYEAGQIVFEQGDPGRSLLVLDSGALESSLAMPGGRRMKLSDMRPGEVLGELSLLGHGQRTATVRAVEDSTCWMLERAAFDVLRNDVRSSASEMVRRIGLQAVERLALLYRRVSDLIEGEPMGKPAGWFDYEDRKRPESTEYLASTLFFRNFTADEVAQLTSGLRQLYVQRGATVVPIGRVSDALYVVIRGAVETSMRGARESRRLRLAGPGRAVGHIGLLGEQAFTERIQSSAREHTVLLEIPWDRVRALLAADDKLSRRFANAVWSDTVRAVQYGEHPLAKTSAAQTATA